ncbi:MAG TPA: hypothetical protein VM050_02065 [Patescibacteria group bacterium]|nr:hypothetical protein [Patescibacteria group bacterium]
MVNAINEARIRDADTSDAEDYLREARAAQDRDDLDEVESSLRRRSRPRRRPKSGKTRRRCPQYKGTALSGL